MSEESKESMNRAFRLFYKDNEASAMDIGRTFKTLEKDLFNNRVYALGFLTRISNKLSEEWVCRRPFCMRIIHAKHWLRTVVGHDLEEVVKEH
jgi:hypothetical protein